MAVKRSHTVLEIAFAQAMQRSGKPAHWYGRRLAECGATPRQVENALATLRAHLRRGNASFRYAARVASLLEIDPHSKLHDLLLKPRTSWPKWAVAPAEQGIEASHQGATGTPRNSESIASIDRAGVAARPVNSPNRRTTQKRIVVLELV
jgi:hypothetical protein